MMTASAALAAVAAARGVVADAAPERRRLRWARPVVRRCGYLGRAERPAEWKLAGKLISIPKPSATLVRAMRNAALERRRLRWARPVVRRCGYLGRA